MKVNIYFVFKSSRSFDASCLIRLHNTKSPISYDEIPTTILSSYKPRDDSTVLNTSKVSLYKSPDGMIFLQNNTDVLSNKL